MNHREVVEIQRILDEVEVELLKARERHPPMNSAHEGISVIREEFEELWDHVKADSAHTPAARGEAIQVAAMAVAFVREICK